MSKNILDDTILDVLKNAGVKVSVSRNQWNLLALVKESSGAQEVVSSNDGNDFVTFQVMTPTKTKKAKKPFVTHRCGKMTIENAVGRILMNHSVSEIGDTIVDCGVDGQLFETDKELSMKVGNDSDCVELYYPLTHKADGNIGIRFSKNGKVTSDQDVGYLTAVASVGNFAIEKQAKA